jgi:hypothetical protein
MTIAQFTYRTLELPTLESVNQSAVRKVQVEYKEAK